MAIAISGSQSAILAALTTATATTITALLGLVARTYCWNSERYPGERDRTRAPGLAADLRVWSALSITTLLAALLLELDGWGVVALEAYWLGTGLLGLFVGYHLAVIWVSRSRWHCTHCCSARRSSHSTGSTGIGRRPVRTSGGPTLHCTPSAYLAESGYRVPYLLAWSYRADSHRRAGPPTPAD